MFQPSYTRLNHEGYFTGFWRVLRDEGAFSDVDFTPLSRVPADWKIIRVLLTASACVLFGMLTVYGLEFMANHWPF